jgi:hypothetical protein
VEKQPNSRMCFPEASIVGDNITSREYFLLLRSISLSPSSCSTIHWVI